MKKLLAIAALLAVLSTTVPAQAMFNHMGKAFRTAVMNRGCSTQPSMFASIHNGRRPLTTLGALIGIGSTGYAVHQAGKQFAKSEKSRKMKQSVALAYQDRDFDCKEDVAEFTQMALMAKDNPTIESDNFWIHARTLTFNYCQKHKKMSREEVYRQNIAHARDTALQWKTKEEPDLAPYIVRNWNLQEWRTRNSQRYEKTVEILERDWQEEQEAQRKQAQRIKELEMLTWLYFA